MTEVEFPAKLRFLFEPHRYKVLWGGRGGIKSWSIAAALILISCQRRVRLLCARELQKSIAESVHELLAKQIKRIGAEAEFRIEQSAIYGPHGTQFAFTGLRDAQNLKSFEGFDICWVEEAANVSARSWDMLIPTIRAENSEIWISFNPELESDETYRRFILHPPPNAVVCKTSWRDNPWLSKELLAELEHCRDTNPDAYLTIWEGHCKQTLDGAVYAAEMRALTARDGITRVPVDPSLPVHTFWDLGIADLTAIWFVQCGAFDVRFVDFLQDRNRPLAWYLSELQKRGYVYGHDHLPHDGKRRDFGTGKSIETQMREAGRRVKMVPQIGLQNGINATRNLFSRAFFDAERCKEGIECVRRYRWKVDPNTKIFSKEPLHDDFSNGADALRMAAVGLTEPDREREQKRARHRDLVTTWS